MTATATKDLRSQAARTVDAATAAEREQRIESEVARLEAEQQRQREEKARDKQRKNLERKIGKATAELLASDEMVENLATGLAQACAENVKLFAAVDELLRSAGIVDLSSIKSGWATRPADRLVNHILSLLRPVFQKHADFGLRNKEAERWRGQSPSVWDRAALTAVAAKNGLTLKL